jgi:LCP family protein required for cell wall assembly
MSKRNKKRLTRRQQEIRRKRLKKRRRRRRLVIILELIILCILGTTAFGLFKLGKMERTNLSNIKNNGLKQTGYTNVALFGLDSRGKNLGKGNRTDTIMIASINNETKKVKLVSVYRDTMLKQNGEHYDKANAAYSVGGPETAVNMLNENLDLDIQDYVSVNFLALADVIDMVDGITVKLTDEEVVHMNNYCVETSKVTGKSYEKIEPEVDGTYHLNGVQAVSYSRIRYTEGGDFKRAERQRLVLQKIADKAQNMSVGTVNKIIDSVFPQISTNFTLAEMIGYAKNLTKYKLGDSIGFPAENTTDMLNEVGSVVIPKTLSSNVLEVHKFLFGSDGYSVSSTIEGIESGITAKASDKAKSGTTIEDDETPGSKGYSGNYSNNSSGTGTTRSTYGTTGGSTYGTGSYGTSNGYSGGTSTGSGTTGSTGSTSSGTTGTTGGTEGTTTGGGTTGDNTGSTSGTTGSTEGTE